MLEPSRFSCSPARSCRPIQDLSDPRVLTLPCQLRKYNLNANRAGVRQRSVFESARYGYANIMRFHASHETILQRFSRQSRYGYDMTCSYTHWTVFSRTATPTQGTRSSIGHRKFWLNSVIILDLLQACATISLIVSAMGFGLLCLL